MSTLLSRSIYQELLQARAFLIDQFGEEKISGIHLPWAGGELLNSTRAERAIYIVGLATDIDYAYGVPQHFEASLAHLEDDFRKNPMERANTPFWRFLSGLTTHLIGRPHYDCTDCWGWSNLFKIAYNERPDAMWPKDLFQIQRSACLSALGHEFRQLTNTLVFIGTSNDRGMVQKTLHGAVFDARFESDGVHFWSDASRNIIYVWGYHPNYAQRRRFFDQMLNRTIWLAERNG